VAYEKVDTPTVGALRGVERRYLVGESVVVVYSDDATSDGNLYVPPAEPYLADGARWWGLGGLAALLMAFAAWAFPANLRRLDRRDARHSV
jgi:hypothetical protein